VSPSLFWSMYTTQRGDKTGCMFLSELRSCASDLEGWFNCISAASSLRLFKTCNCRS
jgi:hypothetical protein